MIIYRQVLILISITCVFSSVIHISVNHNLDNLDQDSELETKHLQISLFKNSFHSQYLWFTCDQQTNKTD